MMLKSCYHGIPIPQKIKKSVNLEKQIRSILLQTLASSIEDSKKRPELAGERIIVQSPINSGL